MATSGSETSMASTPAEQTPSRAPSVAAAPVAGDNNTATAVPASATVMIVVGVVIGIVGVASVITLIWWMRRRHMARYRANRPLPPHNFHCPPAPPPKGGSLSGASKALPEINVANANSYYKGSVLPDRAGSVDKDKALPIKPVESVWMSPTGSHPKSPALANVHELRSQTTPKKMHDEEMGLGRMRSDSVDKEPTKPANFI